MKKHFAFTLAEVLITLSILGVVAAITIPNMIQKYKDRRDITRVKRAYSIVQNALDMAIAENGPLLTWNWPQPNGYYDGNNSNYFNQMLLKYVEYKKDCTNYGCPNYGHLNSGGKRCIKDMNNDIYNCGNGNLSRAAIILKNGMILFPSSEPFPNGWNGNGVLISIDVDINGEQLPNKFGYDVFRFNVHKTKGLLVDLKTYRADSSTYCRNKNSVGTSCSTWVIRHDNMDYKYRDVNSEW